MQYQFTFKVNLSIVPPVVKLKIALAFICHNISHGSCEKQPFQHFFRLSEVIFRRT